MTTAFTYRSLLEAADLSRLPRAKAVFDALETSDFEEVIRTLLSAARIAPAFGSAGAAMAEEMRKDAEALKSILVDAIASRHPDRPQAVGDEAFSACRTFLRNFGCYYTLNYDPLLYWALMHDEADHTVLPRNDGFANPDGETETDYVVWEGGGEQDVHFLHGALHLLDAGAELQKTDVEPDLSTADGPGAGGVGPGALPSFRDRVPPRGVVAALLGSVELPVMLPELAS